ncbi:flavin monoamine oxidase family protein [Bradyrhizobium erythrophlei]|uniref:Tryptophan 2-monooxygenase n=1 Tax=Bradyrhizobium erythrophlei TaxID=1437360 RepID=A0A1H4RPR0_9BRAD|nr:flavin monoamine oxidase family protein [Bradyrhizobium erythrophlei]SEC33873.1 monoamine oxidase [Bradyrhizobium erythrophlei]
MEESLLHDLGDEALDPIIKEYVQIVQRGLPRPARPQNVIIVGAGMAGLTAAYLLRNAGHHVRILEANTYVGGRVHTFRSFSGDLYAEAGAMRIPGQHQLVSAFADLFKLPREPFFNVDIDPATRDAADPVSRNNEWLFVNGVKIRRSAYTAGQLNFPLPPGEKGLTAQQMLDAALAPLRDFIKADPASRWPVVIERFGEFSVRRFLKEQTLYSEEAIEMIVVLNNLESRLMTSFVQAFIELAIINDKVRYWQIPGGNDLLPQAFLPALKDSISFGQRLSALSWDGSGVSLRTTGGETFKGDSAIVAIPFSSLRFVRPDPLFVPQRRRAIRELHYDAATKVLLEFSRRFWEQDDDIYGGGSTTDLANRYIYYPSHDMGSDRGGVVLASYVWGEDALRWDSLTEPTRLQFALDGICALHGEGVRKLYVGGTSKSWMQDPFACGEAAIFAPGQFEMLMPYLLEPEGGKIHFAGEHTSLKHAWIEGAIESGVRTALAVSEGRRPAAVQLGMTR